MTNTIEERKLLERAHSVAVAAEMLGTSRKYIYRATRDSARNARKDVREAIEHLRSFEQLLTRHIEAH